MTFIGIDPGAKGALAVVEKKDSVSVLAGVFPFSTESYRNALIPLRDRNDIVAAVEDVHAMPKQGVSSMFSFGRSKGLVEGMLIAFGITYALVRPQDWKRHYGLISKKGEDRLNVKRASIDAAHRIFGNVSFFPTPRCKVENDGMAEAALIANYIADKLSGTIYEINNIVKGYQ